MEKQIRDELREDPRFIKQRPFLSANDRSRWDTIRALVEHGTYAIDDVIAEPNWDTIDMVKHQDADGDWHLYSSKPPLLATLYAAPYWVVYQVANAFRSDSDQSTSQPITLGTHPYEIGRGLLILYNVVPMLIYFLILGRMLDRFGTTDWGRIVIMATAVLGTFLTTFAVTLNNHLPAAANALVTVWAASRIWYDGQTCRGYYFLSGFFAAFAVACELPALLLLGLVGLALLWRAPKQTLIFGLPAAAMVLAAFIGTNYLAHRSWRLPYMHRGDGPELFTFQVDDLTGVTNELCNGQVPVAAVASYFAQHDITLPEKARVRQKTEQLAKSDPCRWVIEDDARDIAYTIRVADGPDESGKGTLAVHQFDDWYDYDYKRADGRVIPSYWREPKGIDQGETDLGKYTLHALVGHHGIFSLTPMWLLIIPGVVLLCRTQSGYGYPALAALVAIVTLVCVAFYILRPPLDRNYGGMTSGFRWVFWLAPLWLIAALPSADWLAPRRWGAARLRLTRTLGPLGRLSDLEPLDVPLAHQFLALYGLGAVLCENTNDEARMTNQ